MKIAMFTDAYFPRINGVAVSVDSYAAELTKLGHTVCIVCPEYTEEQQRNALFDEKSSDKKSPYQIIRVPSFHVPFTKEDRLGRLNKWHFIKKQMDGFKPDVIHINSEAIMGYFAITYGRHRHVPIVFTFHTLWEEYVANYISVIPDVTLRYWMRKLISFYLKRANLIIAPTQRIKDVVAKYGIEREVHILPTGIPSSKNKYSLKRSLEISSALGKKCPKAKGKKILLYVGRVVKEKNLDFLLDVLPLILKKNPKAFLVFIGGGPYLEELQETAKRRGLENNVFFTGYLPGKDMIYFYKMAQVFVFPSKTETQGLVTVEAMLSGLPVVAVGEMGTLDVMQGDNGGFMVEDDVHSFADKVNLLLENPAIRKEKSNEAKNWGSQWSISALTPRLVELYEKAIREYHK